MSGGDSSPERNSESNDSIETTKKSTHRTHSLMIESAIKKYGSEELIEDKTLDIIASIIRKKLDFLPTVNRKESPMIVESVSQSGGFGGFFGFLVTAVSLIAGLLFIYSHLPGKNKENSQSEKMELSGFKFNANGSAFAGPFEFKSAKEIIFESHCGRKEEFAKFSEFIKNFIRDITTRPKKELDEENVAVKQNFLLEGPPGTGKTIFVRHMAIQIDNHLKLCYLRKKDPAKYLEVINDDEKFQKYMKEAESRVYMCEVAPGIINSKWHGESERNVHLLFESAKVLSEKELSAVFLFFDEGDTFFSTRESLSGSGADETKSSIKSELLQRVGGSPPVDRYRPVFVFCATNRLDVFDSAFKRRFGNQANFGILSSEDREEYIKFLFRNYDLTEDEIKTICQLTQGRAQSFISKHMSDYIRRDLNDGTYKFELRDFLIFLNNNLHNMDLQ